MVLLRDIIKEYEKKVPLQLSLDGDHNGLKIGSRNKEIKAVMGCLELTPEVANYAIKQQIDCIFVHHDPLFFPLHYIDYDNKHTATILTLIKHDIALYVSHTNLDVVENGLNDYMFTLFGGAQAKILDTNNNIGRYGTLKEELNIHDYMVKYIEPVQKSYRLITNNQHSLIKKIAVVNGSGANYLKLAMAKNIDVLITGDVDYHTAMLARECNTTMIDIGHDAERVVHELFTSILKEIKHEQQFALTIINEKKFDFTPW